MEDFPQSPIQRYKLQTTPVIVDPRRDDRLDPIKSTIAAARYRRRVIERGHEPTAAAARRNTGYARRFAVRFSSAAHTDFPARGTAMDLFFAAVLALTSNV